MAIYTPSKGPLSFADIKNLAGYDPTSPISFNDPIIRYLTSEILPNTVSGGGSNNSKDTAQELLGKGFPLTFYFTSGANQDFVTVAKANGWDGVVEVIGIVPNGVVIGSDAINKAALVIQNPTKTGTFPNGAILWVQAGGAIVGCGGQGAMDPWINAIYGAKTTPIDAFAGGPAIALNALITLYNDGVIGGGGGGGGSGNVGDNFYWSLAGACGGGGAGSLGGPCGISYTFANSGDNRFFVAQPDTSFWSEVVNTIVAPIEGILSGNFSLKNILGVAALVFTGYGLYSLYSDATELVASEYAYNNVTIPLSTALWTTANSYVAIASSSVANALSYSWSTVAGVGSKLSK